MTVTGWARRQGTEQENRWTGRSLWNTLEPYSFFFFLPLGRNSFCPQRHDLNYQVPRCLLFFPWPRNKRKMFPKNCCCKQLGNNNFQSSSGSYFRETGQGDREAERQEDRGMDEQSIRETQCDRKTEVERQGDRYRVIGRTQIQIWTGLKLRFKRGHGKRERVQL